MGLGRFLPCRLGANHCWLRSIGWERCGHGLTSSTFGGFWYWFPGWTHFHSLVAHLGLVSLLLMVLLGCGTVPPIFPNKKPTWKLPPSGGVGALVSAAVVHPLVAGLPGSGGYSQFKKLWRRWKEEDTTYQKD